MPPTGALLDLDDATEGAGTEIFDDWEGDEAEDWEGVEIDDWEGVEIVDWEEVEDIRVSDPRVTVVEVPKLPWVIVVTWVWLLVVSVTDKVLWFKFGVCPWIDVVVVRVVGDVSELGVNWM